MPLSSADLRPARVAVWCLMPDAGHVVPLLRIATALRRAGHEVRCFLPEESSSLADEYGLPLCSLGKVESAESEQAKRAVSYSSLGSKLGPVSFNDYFGWVKARASQALSIAKRELLGLGPDVLLTDAHMLLPWYAKAAELLAVPLVYHHSEGTNHTWLDPYTKRNGLSRLPRLLTKTVSKLQERYYRSTAALWRPRAELRLAMAEAERRAASTFSPDRTPAQGRPGGHPISTGLALLEQQRLGLAAAPEVAFFGPIVPEVVAPPAGALGEWLAGVSARPVVYVSFGTMVRLNRRQAGLLLAALGRLEVAVLWSLPASQRDSLAGLSVPPHVRIESHVPQLAVLAAQEVQLVVTHGGSGTVQEALLFGKPLLCVPCFWDQFYNSSVVARLGVGAELSWSLLSAGKLARSVQELLADSRYRFAARGAAAELREQRGGESVVEHIVGIARGALDARRSA